MSRPEEGQAEPVVLYEVRDGVAWVTMNRPQYHNAQNSKMTYALDASFRRAVDDDAVKAIVLRGTGKNFSAGHDIGTPGRDVDVSYERVHLLPDHVGRPGAEFQYVREEEVYLGMCRRWRDIPKSTVAMVQGACIAGGLMLAWICDLIIASDDAYFRDPVVQMGLPGVEYFAHAFELHPRIAKEFLFLGEKMGAERAYLMGMVNRVVPRESLEAETLKVAKRLCEQPPMGIKLTKQAINHVEDLRGKRSAMDAVFAWHHFGHAHNQLLSGNNLAGLDAKAMAAANRKDEGSA
ncbi:MAG: enoyl-CoA hydratase [Pseudomonadota bacterium]|nr:enoyl-CoA hydratase [Pseudomonadota bacterium]